MRRRSHKPDIILFIAIVLLIFTGILILGSASSVISQNELGEPYYFLKHQITIGLIPGIILAITGYLISLKLLKKFAPLLFFLNILLLVLVFFPQFSYGAGGARRWLSFEGISFQPSEIAKLTFILYIAAWLEKKEEKIKSIRFEILPFLASLGVLVFLLYLQPDIGTLAVIITIAIVMIFLGGARLWHFFVFGAIGALGAWELIGRASYRLDRLKAFLNPGIDPMGIGYHVSQALIAIGSGGIFGLGLGQSRQKFNFLPQPTTDSIFAIFSEETGFIGAIILISLFLFFVWRSFKIAKKCPDRFSRLIASGIAVWIGLQAFINIAAISGFLPLTGIPMPYISYGGTSLITVLLASGILLNISKHTV